MAHDIRSLANQLLIVAGIERVISIDDEYAVGVPRERTLGAVSLASPDTLGKISQLLGEDVPQDVEVILNILKSTWDEITDAKREELIATLTPPPSDHGERQSAANDLKLATRLPEIFGKRLEVLSLEDWKARQSELIVDTMPTTLLLVDRNFAGENGGTTEGISIISGLLNSKPEAKIYCALLTNKYFTSTVIENWQEVCDEYELDRARFVLIPKDSLNEDERIFLALIKLVVMNGRARSLVTAVHNSFRELVASVAEKIGTMNIYEFDQVVCVSGYREGVWEADTLVRIFALYHNLFVRQALRKDPNIFTFTNELRSLSQVKLGDWKPTPFAGLEIKRLEWYAGSEVNEQLLPIEIGDLFKIETDPESVFMLVAPPCDLMVRKDGGRFDTIGRLLRVSPHHGGGEDEFGYILEAYEGGRDWRVNLHKVSHVRLEVLDLCALQPDGTAKLDIDAVVPNNISLAWKVRAKLLKKAAKKLISNYNLLLSKTFTEEEANLFCGNGGLEGLITGQVSNEGVFYNIRRVGRLRQPRAGAVLAKYANSVSRDAFDHDLTMDGNFPSDSSFTERISSEVNVNKPDDESTSEDVIPTLNSIVPARSV
jgi:hypothetical protein